MAARRPQDLVFSLYGEYLLDRGGPIWVGSLIELLAPFGLSENAVRTALSRMVRKGWLGTERQGRRSLYGLTARGRRLLREGAERIYHPPRDAPWDGSWHLVTYSIPEEQRELRDRFRLRLTWLGLGSLGGGLWISPRDVREPIATAADELGIVEQVEIFRGVHLGFSDARRLVARCWDMAAIAARHRRFVRRFEPLLREGRAAAAAGGIIPREAFVRRLELIHEARDFPLFDPFLPRSLLPEDWIGDRAARLFETFRDLLTRPADMYVDGVLEAASVGELAELPV
jgi:phenylacetic acid degradation operon negative regulatory protein